MASIYPPAVASKRGALRELTPEELALVTGAGPHDSDEDLGEIIVIGGGGGGSSGGGGYNDPWEGAGGSGGSGGGDGGGDPPPDPEPDCTVSNAILGLESDS